MIAQKMSALEKRAVFSISSLMSLRMIGLFMVLPVFSLYAQQIPGSTPTLIGIAMGIYGLAQAVLQIPFGSLSDRFGRKPIILIGFIIFMIGSLIAGLAHNMIWLIIGRTLQGAGAIGSTMLAMIADLTTEEQRTKSMAIAGIGIGFSFSIAMFAGPILTQWLAVNQLFYIAVIFGALAIILLYTMVPTPKHVYWHRDTEPELKAFFALLKSPELAKLNSGIFILHAVFTASFVIIPISLLKFDSFAPHNQWILYVPTLIIAFFVSLIFIGLAERQQKLKPYFIGAILTLMLAELCLWLSPHHLILSALGLCLFFGGFSLLEAFLPSLISRTAPAARKGSALGIYSCAQFLGIFVGGVLGGWLYGRYSFTGVYLFCIVLSSIWLFIALLMQAPRYLVTQLWRVPTHKTADWQAIAAKLRVIPGMVEVTFIPEDSMAYLKMERRTTTYPELIHLKNSLSASI